MNASQFVLESVVVVAVNNNVFSVLLRNLFYQFLQVFLRNPWFAQVQTIESSIKHPDNVSSFAFLFSRACNYNKFHGLVGCFERAHHVADNKRVFFGSGAYYGHVCTGFIPCEQFFRSIDSASNYKRYRDL